MAENLASGTMVRKITFDLRENEMERMPVLNRLKHMQGLVNYKHGARI